MIERMVERSAAAIGGLVQEGPNDFRVHGRVFCDPDIFAMEMERIFGRCWVFLAHESEVARAGDYRTGYIGTQPLIITRDPEAGRVHVLFNRCRHRAASVCQEERGNASFFRCAYHGWTYNNRGELTAVTYRDAYHGSSFDKASLGLSALPRVEMYRGFIFGCLDPGAPPLETYLGNTRKYLDQLVGLSPSGEIEVRGAPQRYLCEGNWKTQLENTTDGYHGDFVHKSFIDLLQAPPQARSIGQQGTVKDLGGGHGCLDFGQKKAFTAGEPLDDIPFNMAVFPNLALVSFHIRVIRPISPNLTEILYYPWLLKGGSADVNARRIRLHERNFGPAGLVGTDDKEMFERVDQGLKATAADPWLIMARGMHRERREAGGICVGADPTDEVPLRGLYRRWKELMSAEQAQSELAPTAGTRSARGPALGA